MSERTRGTIAASALGMGVSWNIANVGAVAEPIAAHYGVGLATVGLFTAVLFAAELASMAAVGRLIRRHGVKAVGMLALGLCVAGNLLTPVLGGVGAALALRFVVGLGVGLGFVGGTTYVQQIGGGPLAQGLFGGLSLGTGGLAVAVIPGIEGWLGWEAPFVSAALVALPAAAILLIGPDIRPAGGGAESRFVRLLGDRRLLRFAAVQSAAFGLGIVLSNWVVTVLTRRGDYDPATAGLIGALILLVGVLGRPGGGLYAQLRPEHTRRFLLAALLLGAAGTLTLGLAPPAALATLAAISVGVAAGVPFGPIVAGLGRAFPEAPGAAFAAMNTYALLVIIAGSPLLGATFALPGEGLIGFALAAALWLLAATVLPEDRLLVPRGDRGPDAPAAPSSRVETPRRS